MDKAMQAALLEEFKADQVGYKPTVHCKACTDAKRNRQGHSCKDHQAKRCPKCATYITEAHICLAFVGHADVRHRLCMVDPEWTWEPFEFPGQGALILDAGGPVGLWINLTIGGVTKPGYGSCGKGKESGDAMKELIGDAIRNAGQSFGIAWYLWAKGDRDKSAAVEQDAAPAQSAPRQGNGRRSINAEDIPPPDDAVRGTVSRPAAAPRPPAATGEPDPDAQPYADEAHEARTVAALKVIHVRAREAHKLAALIRNPGTGGIGGLGAYMNWKKAVLEKAEAALAALEAAGKAAGLSPEELDAEVLRQAGKSIEDATAEDMEKVTAVLATLVKASA